ncbi:L-threonylcarbamoyladenylate synthase [Vallitalea guaymasensis]|uniref:Threonylcarbamoyl-AMP synthase n=1 Tax=Vallitalea guaymasensis TaxID=1185412 RepID=A0A8J8MAT0_9FIRM|nr:L-threonylcarbamoyladenylate synthase [Vallitalea guaymasensis]QUH29507.1 threonylcarbamoyl-AMP synthase [Vallitalea guaymasensis]
METIIRRVDINNIDNNIIVEAANILQNGGLVAFPTETVYGIGANSLEIDAVKKIYMAKGRPSDNPLIVHVAGKEDVKKYVTNISMTAEKLMDRFWPGPLTLIFEKKDIIPDNITGGLSTVAIRMPSHKIARSIIEASNLPIAAPSANVSGKPSPTMAKHVINDLSGKVDMIVDGGFSEIGLESTVLDVSGTTPTILRPGGITKEMLEEVIGSVSIDPAIKSSNKNLVPKAPGMKYRHYAPNAELIVFKGKSDKVVSHINELVNIEQQKDKKIGVIATKQTEDYYDCKNIISIGDKNNPEEIASNLFRVLREFDEMNVEIIYCEAFSKKDIGTATMNRLLKAAGNKIINID